MDIPNLITGTLCRRDTTNTSCYSRITSTSEYFSVAAAFVSIRFNINIHDIIEIVKHSETSSQLGSLLIKSTKGSLKRLLLASSVGKVTLSV